MNDKKLFVFANQFPYGYGETYMETEMTYWDKFEKVYIISLQLREKNMNSVRTVPVNAEIISIPFNIAGYLIYSFVAFTDGNFYSELKMLVKSNRLSLRSIAQLFTYVSRSHYESNVIRKKLNKRRISYENVVFYSYRFGYQPYVACLLKEKLHLKCDIYARAHGYDLYENRKKSGYIPMRRYLLKSLNYCFPVSNDGTKYLRDCFPIFADKIQTRYLGTADHGIKKLERQETFKVVSCSNIVPVKRIDIIIDVLTLIKDYKIEWTHYGSGILEQDVKKKAEQKLPVNITVHWRGVVPNAEVLHDYKKEQYNLFINVSTSEGLPVSIMEAASFGIPCIATDAGGTGELIENGTNGILLPVETSAEEIAKCIVDFITMSDLEYERYCMEARRIWKEKFWARKNYTNFVNEICNNN